MNQMVMAGTEGCVRLIVGLRFKAYLITMDWDYVQWERCKPAAGLAKTFRQQACVLNRFDLSGHRPGGLSKGEGRIIGAG
jgi:hypothetical protein